MYHKISAEGVKDFLTVSSTELEEQFAYLQKQGYTPLLLSDLVDHIQQKKELPHNPVLISFDDGYRDNWTAMYPLLKKYGMKANIFLVASFLQQGDSLIDKKGDEFLMVSDVLAMDPSLVEFGLHTYDHKSYKTLSSQEIKKDIEQTKLLLTSYRITFQSCLAFTYGAFPKRGGSERRQFFKTLAENNILIAFRIGNRLNPLPLKNPLLVQRLDIRGDTSITKFVRLLKRGKKLF